jgi:hypothetical protein
MDQWVSVHRASSARLVDQSFGGLNRALSVGDADGICHHQIHGLPADRGQLPLQIEVGLHETSRLNGLELHQHVEVATAGPGRGP